MQIYSKKECQYKSLYDASIINECSIENGVTAEQILQRNQRRKFSNRLSQKKKSIVTKTEEIKRNILAQYISTYQ